MAVGSQAKLGPSAVRVQRWFRGQRVMMKFTKWARRRREFRRQHFMAWQFLWRVRRFVNFQLKMRYFKELATEASETKEVNFALYCRSLSVQLG